MGKEKNVSGSFGGNRNEEYGKGDSFKKKEKKGQKKTEGAGTGLIY